MITWRPYQTESIDAVFEDWKIYKNVLGVAATGAGKTEMFLGIAERFIKDNPGARVLVVAHREELIDQPEARIRLKFPELAKKVGVVMGSKRDDHHRQIIVGTIQTVGGKSRKRINQILSYGKIDLLIIDEAHHAEANQYYQTFLILRTANPDLKVLGVTATPERGDKKLLTRIFERESFNISPYFLIKNGWLCEPIFQGVQTKVDLSGAKVYGKGGKRDYKEGDIVSAFETEEVFDIAVNTHLENCKDEPTAYFTVSVSGCIKLTEKLKAAGVKAVAMYSARPRKNFATQEEYREEVRNAKKRRKDANEGMRSGKYTCLVNVMIATEGWDFPPLRHLHILRPTKSDGLWIQMVGRVLRLSPETGKTVGYVYDYKPLADRSLEQRMQIYKPPKMKRAAPETPAERNGAGDPKVRSTGEYELVILDYLNRRKEAWIETADGWRCIQLGKGVDQRTNRPVDRGLALSPDGLELWAIWRFRGDNKTGIRGDRWAKARVIAEGDAHANLEMIDTYTQAYGNRIIMSRSAAWRNTDPKQSLITWGDRLGVYKEGMTQGELSDAINQHLIMGAVRRGIREASELEREQMEF